MVVYEHNGEKSTAELSEDLRELLTYLWSIHQDDDLISTSYTDEKVVEMTL